MPVSKKRKPKTTRISPGNVPSRTSYRPTVLPESTADVVDRLLTMPPQDLPSVGLAEWYLAMSPNRQANQCVLASLMIMTVIRSFGLDAEIVALQLDVPSPGGTKRYGSDAPHMDGEQVVGHVGLITDDHFIDPTASQFPEIASHGGVRVIAQSLGGGGPVTLRQGEVTPTRLTDHYQVQYTILPLGSEDALTKSFNGMNDPRELTKLVDNLRLSYLVVLANKLNARVETLTKPRYAPFVAAVRSMQGKVLRMEPDSRMFVDGDSPPNAV